METQAPSSPPSQQRTETPRRRFEGNYVQLVASGDQAKTITRSNSKISPVESSASVDEKDRLEKYLETLSSGVRDQFHEVLRALEVGFRLPSLDNPADLKKGYPFGVFKRYEGITFLHFRALLFNILTARNPIMPTDDVAPFLLGGLQNILEKAQGEDFSAVELDKALFAMGTRVDGKRGALGGF